jgi:hypothetical protein
MINKTKLKFNNQDLIQSNYSQSGQDLFVLMITNGKKNGVFLDIGAHHPTFISNTYLLEKEFGWAGTLIELDDEFCKLCKDQRSSKLICEDATTIDYSDFFNKKFVDYISLDIDGFNSLKVLESLPISLSNTGVITFEHDSYRFDNSLREKSREFIQSKGFYRLCSDVCNENNPFEDWYINPEIYNVVDYKILESNSLNWESIILN